MVEEEDHSNDFSIPTESDRLRRSLTVSDRLRNGWSSVRFDSYKRSESNDLHHVGASRNSYFSPHKFWCFNAISEL